ncbi:restriction endonuclease subunit S [Megamonas funiformis]|uniref:restriction endonuclease subunit S n=1 Tax=Megamonas funiformis TaxID=437897 RepID=UPI00195CC35D|nr:restriction endonuclease subunit S [Megamonas funiformis]MBM6726918.1 restriction endonuclease subunit S [Megamonas funiformis]
MLADKLRKSVLQSAIQGNLTEQLATDDKVEDLLQAIEEEKELLIKEKKIKKQKPLPEITEDEIPFAIPENWKWVRLGEVIELISGRDLVKDKYNNNCEGIPYITGASNFNNNNLIIDRWTNEATSIAIKNDILLTCKGTIGEIAVLKENKVHIARQIMSIRLLQGNIEYIKWYIISQIDKLKSMGKSIIPGISREMILNYLIPLPPLAEQKRIVEKLDNVLANIDELKANEEKLSILQKNFPDKLKKSILQSAIQGKLTEQLATDDNVEDLLQAIKEEKERLIKEKKIKKQKPLPEITEEERPFEIPENWKWVRLGELGDYKKGPFGSALTKSMFIADSHEAVKVYEQKNAIKKDWKLGNYFIDKKYYEEKMKGFTVLNGDLIVSCAGTIGEQYFIPSEARIGIINQALMRIRIYKPINKRFYSILFNYVIKLSSIRLKGSAIKNILPFEVLKNIVVPLPPLAEQKRIVEKLDKLLADIEELKI